uniref:YsnF/AvaK domain-containing protein n=1 Tax=Muricoccus aerilatus TaxID=452982 RepID=UPI0005C157DE
IVEEQVRIGKRDVERGRVRVRSYIVETPVTEQVTLREEHVDVQRRSVNRPLTDADEAFRERVIDATEHSEEAVVGKEARVKEELVIRKDASDRTETVHDTVRRTEVEVDDTTGTSGTAGSVGVTGTTGSNPPGTAASRAVDKTLGTNISGANPDKR